MNLGPQSMVGRLELVVVKAPDAALAHAPADEWSELGWHAPIDPERAAAEHARLVSVLESVGAEVIQLPPDERTGLDSLYAHDASMATPAGVVPLRPGKAQRCREGEAVADALAARGIPVLDGLDDPAATVEGGDLTWLDPETLIVGRSFRTNARGVASLRRMLEPSGVKVHDFDIPYGRGPGEVLHLMSFLSMIDRDLALVYPALLPVALAELLEEKDIERVPVPEAEMPTQGCNVLALAPRHALVLDGNPRVRSLLETRGCTVERFAGSEISMKGDGGPTCLTRPLRRQAPSDSESQ